MKNICGWVLAACAVVLAGSCGGDDEGAACSAFTACGGNVVGTWEVQDYCVSGKLAVDECPGATTTFEGADASGTITYNADMTTTSNVTVKGTMKMNLPASCLMGLTCAALDALLKGEATLSDPDSPFGAISCTGSSSCTCTLPLKPNAMMGSGTWRTQGNQLIDEDGETNDFCATDKELKIQSVSTMSSMMDELRFGVQLIKK